MNLKALVGKLSPTAREALEGAAAITLSRTHYDVEPEHWLLKLPEQADVAAILRHFEADSGRIAAKLNAVLDGFKSGNGRPPALSPRLVKIAREAWLDASIERQADQIGGGDILLAMLADRDTGPALREQVPELKRISAEVLAANLAAITGPAQGDAPASGEAPATAPRPGGSGKALDTYCIDLTQRARDGGIDPVIGRDTEIRQLADILTRRRRTTRS